MSNAEPPEEINGSGTPIMGSKPVTIAMFINVWHKSQVMMAPVVISTKVSLVLYATRNMPMPKVINRPMTNSAPTSPSSSPNTAKIRSLPASGMYDHFWRDWPNPTPDQPPEAKAKMP